MGLIGIMVAGTSLLIGLMGAMQLVRTQQKQRADADRTRDVEAIFNEIRLVLNDSTNCNATFAGKTVDGGTVTAIKSGGNDRYKTISSDANATYGSMKIKLESFKLQKDQDSDDSMWLQIVFDRNSHPSKKDLVGKRFQLAVTKSAGKVGSCHGWYEQSYSNLWYGSTSLIKPTSATDYIEINVDAALVSTKVAGLEKHPFVAVMGPPSKSDRNTTFDMDDMLTPSVYKVCGDGYSYFETSSSVGDALVSSSHSDCFGRALVAAGKIKIGAHAPQSSVDAPGTLEYFSAVNRYYQDATTWYLQERYDYGIAYICAAFNSKL